MRQRTSLGAATIILSATVALGGCHNYLPIDTPAPGSIVRVGVPVTTVLSDPNAPAPSVSIEGTVLESGETLVLATETRRELGAFREIIQFDTIRLAPDQRSSIEVREFSTKKSIGLGAVIAGGATLLAVSAFGLAGGDGGDGPNNVPPTPAVVVSSSILSAIWGIIGN